MVNPASGSGTGARVIDEVRESPCREAEIVELGDDDDVEEALRAAAAGRRCSRSAAATGRCHARRAWRWKRVFRWRSSRRHVQPLREGHRLRHAWARRSMAIRSGSVACVDLVCLNERPHW